MLGKFSNITKKITAVVFPFISQLQLSKKVAVVVSKIFAKATANDKYVCHAQNIAILIASYSVTSIVIYPEFRFHTFYEELFMVICGYVASLLWFTDKVISLSRYKIAIAVNSGLAPSIFINNAPSVAFVEIFFLFFMEYIFFEYMRGCRLFSDLIPIYAICEDEQAVKLTKNVTKQYKVLEFIVLEHTASSDKNKFLNELKTVEDIGKWLTRINRILFYPTPRKLLYFSIKENKDTLSQLAELSRKFSIFLFKATSGDLQNSNKKSCKSEDCVNVFNISP